MPDPTTSTGGCHCGAVRFTVPGAPSRVFDCNCSLCAMTAYVHWMVPQAALTLHTPWDALTEYRFNTGVARHLFCRRCGIKSFYVPRSDPDHYSINVRCLDRVDWTTLTRVPFDGQNWEAHHATYVATERGP